MSIATKPVNLGSDYKFGTGDVAITDLSVERSYSVSIDIVDGNGGLTDILYGGEEVTISCTKVGSTVPTLGESFSAGGATGYVTKFAKLQSNEDVNKVQIEAFGAPGIPGGTGGTGGTGGV
jgi:hypothetical protein